MTIHYRPIAFVHSTRIEVTDDHWNSVSSFIELTDEMPEESLSGLDQFSHAEIVFHFHKAEGEAVVAGASHPRGNPEWPAVGIFAQRRKARPNLIGCTIVEIDRIEGRKLFVRKFDAIDGTPVLDIKPVFKAFLPSDPVREPAWASELTTEYW